MESLRHFEISLIEPNFQKDTYLTSFQFAHVYKSLSKQVFLYGIRIVNDRFIIENIIQEAFLKLWNYRDTITGLEHAKAFLMLNIKWECHTYFRSPASRFHRRFTYLDSSEDYNIALEYHDTDAEAERDEITEVQLKAITDMITFLPEGREKKLLRLYYIDGLSYKQIAGRYDITISAASTAIRNGIGQLRAMIVRPQKLLDVDKGFNAISADQRVWLYDLEGLNREQSQIYRLRTECKYSFERVANTLNLPQAYVQQEYVKAWKVAGQIKKGNANATFKGQQSYKLVTYMIA